MSAPVIVISGCLAGLPVRYDRGSRPHSSLQHLARQGVLVPVCPEILGGLGIPRSPCCFIGGDGTAVLNGSARIIDDKGQDRTAAFLRGAEATLHVVELVAPSLVIFKEGSPSCGLRRVNIAGIKQAGCGTATAYLQEFSVPVISEEDPIPLTILTDL